MNTNRIEIILNEVDLLIKEGKATAAKTKLLHSKPQNSSSYFNRKIRLRFCILARRLGMPEMTVRLLSTIVRPQGRSTTEASTEEKTHYAAALIKIGAVNEGLEILLKLDHKTMPEILLYEAFAYFALWDYKKSVPILENYIKVPTLTDYQREVGRANLAAALVHENDKRAIVVLETLLQHAKKNNYSLIEGIAYLSFCEYHFTQKQYNEAENNLKLAAQIYNTPDLIETLFIEKWHALIDMAKSCDSKNAIKKLDAVRNKAREKKDWETLRSCDYYQSIILKNKELLIKNHFGTPFESMKHLMLEAFENPVSLPDYYDWSQVSSKNNKTIELNMNETLKERQSSKRLLLILASDFYKPYRMATLHHLLYPKEYFNIQSSPLRVRKAISRLRKLIKETKLPIKIEEISGSYRIAIFPGHSLRVPKVKPLSKTLDLLVEELRAVFKGNLFTARQAGEALKINRWAAIELLRRAAEENLVLKSGSGNKIFYEVTITTEINHKISA